MMTTKNLKKLLASASLLAVIGASSIAQAQNVPQSQVEQAFPGRVEEQIERQEFQPRVAPKIQVRERPVQAAPEGAEKIAFTLEELRIDGVSAYKSGDLRGVYAGELGQTITLADLYGIAADLTRKYRNDGYILTQVIVPPQTIEGGIARLQVVEGYINNIQVRGEGEEKTALDLIKKMAANMKADGGALNAAHLERSLLLINDLPGVEARSILSPSTTQPGAADLLVIVERDPYDALVSIDNYGTRFLGPVQISAAGSANSFFGYNEKITGQYVIAPDRGGPELYYYSMSYEQPIFDNGTTVEVFGTFTNTEPGFDLAPFEVHGNSRLGGVRVKHPFIRSRTLNLTGRATFDYRNVDSKNNTELLTRKDRIRALRAGGTLETLDTFMGAGFNIFDVEVARGLKIFNANADADPNTSRAAARPDFWKANAEVQRLQRVTSDVNLLLGAKGQVSNGALYASEEFGVGGLAYGRAYDASEIIGDNGFAGKVEVQWKEPYPVPTLEGYQVFGFLDAGRIFNDDPATNAAKTDTLVSTGGGVRADITSQTSADLFVAKPLNRDVQTQRDEGLRLYFSLAHEF